MPDTNSNTTRSLADQALDLHNSTPDGAGIQDMDTVLKDIMDESCLEENGTGPELVRIWKESRDKASIESLFELLSGVTLQEYLEKCIRETTRA